MTYRFRYVTLPDVPTLAEVDAALDSLRHRRMTTAYPIVRTWVGVEIDAVLDLRDAAVLEAMV
jgi:hypothetical protein